MEQHVFAALSRRRRRQALDPKVAIGYLRCSTSQQELSPKAQRAALDRWATAHGVVIVACFADEGVGGAADLSDRPSLLLAIEALREHGAGVLLVSRRDRLARDRVLAGLVERLVERCGARVVAADGVEIGEGPEAALLSGLLDLVAEFERGLIKARTRAALAVKRSRRERAGGIGWGWRLAPDRRRLVPNERERSIIRVAGKLRSRGATLREIAEELGRRGHRTRARRARWLPQQVRALLLAGRRD